MFVQRQQMARTLATQDPMVLLKCFKHIAVAYFGANEFQAQLNDRIFHSLVGHQGANDTTELLSLSDPFTGHQVQQFISVEQPAMAIYKLQTIGIPIQGNPKVRLFFFDHGDEGLRVRCTHVLVDVHAVGATAQGMNLRSKLKKNSLRDLIGRPMSCIDHNPQTL